MPALILSGILGWWISGHLQAADPQPATTPDSTVPAESPVADTKGDSVANSVVKIFSTLRRPDVYKPWLKQSPEDISGSGVVIKGNRILTNAHVVLYATQIQVQANQAGDKFFAQVEFVAPGIDLAVLKLDDERFFEGHPPLLPAHALPAIKDTVMTYGYPLGGDSLSITKGIVSRIEYGYLYNWPVLGLRIQVDAAINPGNSGGPVVSGNSMIGLAFSGYSPKQGVQNIGYVIPSEEIELFLQDIADGHYDGKPTIFDSWFYIQNPTMRDYLQMNKDQSGVMISKVYSSDPDYPLKVWDVISKIGDTHIDDQGKIGWTLDIISRKSPKTAKSLSPSCVKVKRSR
jgi:S1-C subfamily serine protease